MNAKELIRFLNSKNWSIRRTMFDRKINMHSSFAGEGYFLSKETGWIYQEHGEFFNASCTYAACRRYNYEIKENNCLISFENGSPFYSFDCNQLPEVSFHHNCGNDRYTGKLSIDLDGWKNEWRIAGPNKEIEIRTEYF